jgi:uncharacterized protein
VVDIQKELLPANAILSYSDKDIKIQNQSYGNLTLVTEKEIVNIPNIQSIQELSLEVFDKINMDGIEVIIIGHTESYAQIPMNIRQSFAKQQIGMEAMNLGAACRTFNILLSEGRGVLGVFIVE